MQIQSCWHPAVSVGTGSVGWVSSASVGSGSVGVGAIGAGAGSVGTSKTGVPVSWGCVVKGASSSLGLVTCGASVGIGITGVEGVSDPGTALEDAWACASVAGVKVPSVWIVGCVLSVSCCGLKNSVGENGENSCDTDCDG